MNISMRIQLLDWLRLFLFCYICGVAQIYHLYCGLPTNVRVNAPFYIDAPYMLTTSRDHVLHDNLWNTVVTAAVYSAVNNLELNPQYYWAEMRIALCLECSKRFKDDRSNKLFYSRFLEEVKTANPLCNEPITIDCLNDQITFTQKHLAEIQQIFRLMERLQ